VSTRPRRGTDAGRDGASRPTATESARAADNVKGALFMMASMGGFVVNDALMKSLAGEVALFQAIFVRGLVATALLAALAWAQGVVAHPVRGADRVRLGIRVGAEVGATSCFLNALFHMPIANATAILLVMPLAVTLAGALFLGERVGWRRYGAILVGFAGVLVIVRPGGEGFNAYALSALAAVGFLVVRDLVTRRFAAGVPSVVVALATAVAITVMGGAVSLVGPWSPLALGQVVVVATAACFLVVGYLFGVMTMRVGDIGFVSPFRYTVLIWALLLGIAVFGEIPDAATLVGSALVVATGLYTFHRERRAAPGGG
jgi:drug/metabolite transporter (DMT)-like permease